MAEHINPALSKIHAEIAEKEAADRRAGAEKVELSAVSKTTFKQAKDLLAEYGEKVTGKVYAYGDDGNITGWSDNEEHLEARSVYFIEGKSQESELVVRQEKHSEGSMYRDKNAVGIYSVDGIGDEKRLFVVVKGLFGNVSGINWNGEQATVDNYNTVSKIISDLDVHHTSMKGMPKELDIVGY